MWTPNYDGADNHFPPSSWGSRYMSSPLDWNRVGPYATPLCFVKRATQSGHQTTRSRRPTATLGDLRPAAPPLDWNPWAQPPALFLVPDEGIVLLQLRHARRLWTQRKASSTAQPCGLGSTRCPFKGPKAAIGS
jgi:hypothetical protein